MCMYNVLSGLKFIELLTIFIQQTSEKCKNKIYKIDIRLDTLRIEEETMSFINAIHINVPPDIYHTFLFTKNIYHFNCKGYTLHLQQGNNIHV